MSDSTAGRMLCEGEVQFTFGEHTNKHGFIKIYCIGGAGHPARIEVFDNKKTASKGKPLLYQIPFQNVKNIVTTEVQGKPRTAITVQGGDTFIFLSSDINNDTEMLKYTKLLYILPNYVIPEIPKRCLVSQQYIEQCCDCSKYDAVGVWVVYFINEGVGPLLNFTGLHIVTIRTTNLTFNIHNFYNGKHLLAWEHCKIRRSGCVGPLVFLEIGSRCQGGPGVLWMYYPAHLAQEFRESLNRFIHNNTSAPTEAEPKAERISVDENLSKTYKSRRQLHLTPLEALNQDTPPPLPAKPQTNMNNSNENGLSNGHIVQDDPVVHELEKFRPRTAVMSSADGKKYRAACCKSKKASNTQTVASQCDDQYTASGASNKENCLDKPPPLPPKPMSSSKLHAKKGTSSSSINSVYQHSMHTESLSLLEERMPVQPSQPQEWQKRSEKTNATPRNKYQMQTTAFEACSRIITDNLDVKSVFPELNSCHLLTEKDRQFLINQSHEDYDKALYLLHCLPRKGNEWFDKFLWCLDQSSSNTGHGDIIDSLKEKLQELEDQDADITALASDPIPVSPEHIDGKEPYTVFVDSPDTVSTLQVRSSEMIRSLMRKIRQKFNILPDKSLKLQVDDRHVCNSAHSSLSDSKINRYSFITVTVLDISN